MLFEEINKKYKTFIFDNDGVILDSNQAKTDAFIKCIEGNDKSKIEEFIKHHTENGGVSRFEKIEYFYKHILKLSSYEKKYQTSLEIYADQAKKSMLIVSEIPGFIKLINKILEGKNTAYVISGSDQEELIDIYSIRGLDKYFDLILGSPTSKKENAEFLINTNKISYPVIYFGDSITDYNVAEEFNMDFVFVSSKSEWRDGREICIKKQCLIIDDFNEIL